MDVVDQISLTPVEGQTAKERVEMKVRIQEPPPAPAPRLGSTETGQRHGVLGIGYSARSTSRGGRRQTSVLPDRPTTTVRPRTASSRTSSDGPGRAKAPSKTKRTRAHAASDESRIAAAGRQGAEHGVLGEQDPHELRPGRSERAQEGALADALVAARRHRAGQHGRPGREAEQRHEADREDDPIEDPLDRALHLGEIERRDVRVRLDDAALQAWRARSASSTRESTT